MPTEPQQPDLLTAPEIAEEAAREGRQLARAPARTLSSLTESMAAITMMERLAKNSAVDVAKMREARELAMEIVRDQRRDAFHGAMAAAQAEMGPIRADAENDETKSRYGSHAALDRALRPIYTKHGFDLTFDTEPNPLPEMMTFICEATAHGHTRRYRLELPVDGKGPKGGNVMSRTHAASSGVTYAMRILLKMVFNIAIDRDDDGNAAGRVKLENIDPSKPTITLDQETILRDKCKEVGCSPEKFLNWAKVDKFENIPADIYDRCLQGLNTFRKS